MPHEQKMPRPGDRLVHRFNRRGEVAAEVISVDEQTGKITLSVDGTTYPSLSAAGQAVAGYQTNGWVFWGLKSASKRTEADH